MTIADLKRQIPHVWALSNRVSHKTTLKLSFPHSVWLGKFFAQKSGSPIPERKRESHHLRLEVHRQSLHDFQNSIPVQKEVAIEFSKRRDFILKETSNTSVLKSLEEHNGLVLHSRSNSLLAKAIPHGQAPIRPRLFRPQSAKSSPHYLRQYSFNKNAVCCWTTLRFEILWPERQTTGRQLKLPEGPTCEFT